MAKQADTIQTFLWEGLNKNGARMKGELNALNSNLVYAELKRQGISPIKVNKKPKSLFAGRQKKITPQDIVVLSRHLATMLGAGLTLIKGLEIIGNSHEKPAMQNLIGQIKTDVEGGGTLHQALNKHPKYFDPLFTGLVKAGEQSGTLDKLLNRIAIYLEKTASLKKKIKKALFYPTAVVIAAIVVSSVLLIFVIPKFQELFSSSGKQLPAFTQMVINLSEFLRHKGWMVVVALVVFAYLFRKVLKTSVNFRTKLDKYILKVPIIGNILEKATIARITRTLATTLAAGIPIIDALQSAAETANNLIFYNALQRVKEEIATGQQLHVSMTNTGIFPKFVTQMIAVGEESGATEDMLNKIATYFEEDVDTAVDSLSSLLEPLIMAILGIVIGGLVIAMYLPIFKMGSAF